ncbi:MAG TPA: response regulator [Gemmatimonadales bacterium]|nr:response regulator [Gemmatimonadales bacterium]
MSYIILAAAAVVLVVISAARLRQSEALAEANAAVLHTTDVLSTASELAALRRDREVATLLWITRDEAAALQTGRALGPVIDSTLGRLERLTRDNPAQQARLADFRQLMTVRAALLRGGQLPADRDAALDSSVAFGRKAEAIVAALRVEENRLLAERRETAARVEAGWRRYALLAAAASLLFALGALLSLRIQRRLDQQAAALVRRSESRFRAAAESGFDTFMLLEPASGTPTPSLRVLDVNQRAAEMLGAPRESLVGQAWERMHPIDCPLPADLAAQVAEVLRTGHSVEATQRVTSGSDVRTFRYQLLPADETVAVTCREVTDEVQLAEQLQQSQKLDALGRMASGVAHDFNNLLTVLRAEADLVLDDTRLDPSLRPEIEDMIRAVDRAAGLTQRLLAFSRKQVTAPRPMALDRAIEDLRTFLVRMLPRAVRVETDHAVDQPPILLDPVQLDQMVLNLAANARDAMPEGGTFSLTTDVVSLAADASIGKVRIPKGRWVRLQVADTGVGMSADVLGRIFEPFFTTKGPGRGTGLGLSSVHGVVAQAGGHLTVESAPGAGTRFGLYFPPQLDRDRGPTLVTHEPLRAGPASLTVLLAEDEPAVRAVTERILARAGYTVVSAGSGEEAYDLFKRRLEEIDVLLTDIVMPGMNGQELAVRVTREKPNLPVLFVSGYVGDAVQIPADVVEAGKFLQKPFTTDELLDRLRRISAA